MKSALNRRTVMLAVSAVLLLAAGFATGVLVGRHGLAESRAAWTGSPRLRARDTLPR
jgi:hypothetical protein